MILKTKKILSLFIMTTVLSNAVVTDVSAQKNTYRTFKNDPINVREYKLDNGLTFIASVNKNEPRIQTMIGIKAGSKHDPSDATGLAHYLEHMMFKGTRNFGTQNWEKEKVLLDEIKNLYEKHRETKDAEKKKEIYAQIDKISHEASGLAIPNEYDKMISSLGAKGTNAFTSVEQTVYINDIPNNELEKWLKVESERFREVVLRLFHTELEAVYEEFNIGQANDDRKVYKTMMESLFPKHTYGTQTTIGTGEHLKNPSMVRIYEYFSTYYVPNNMVIVMSGDFNPDEVFVLINKYFGDYTPKAVPEFVVKPQPEITSKIVREVFGKEKAVCEIGYRFQGAGTRENLLANTCAMLLNNGKAGLIDLNVIQKQTMLEAGATMWNMKDFSVFNVFGTPREGQSVEEVEKLLQTEVEKLKKGEFDEWLIKACANDGKLDQMRAFERNQVRANILVRAFTQDLDWQKFIDTYDEMAKISKQEIMQFAEKNFKDNYVVIYKREGEDKEVYKVDKPSITANKIVRDVQSDFCEHFTSIESKASTPEFVDFNSKISTQKINDNVSFKYIKNNDNALFNLYYVFKMGTDNDKELDIALKYLNYLGTDKYTPEALKQEFFKLGASMDTYASRDYLYVTLSGLEESFVPALKLFEHVLQNVKPNKEIYANVVSDILKSRADDKKNKGVILFSAMLNYAIYGEKNPFNNIISEKELNALNADVFTEKIKNLLNYPHDILYYGIGNKNDILKVVSTNHVLPKQYLPYPKASEYTFQSNMNDEVVLFDFDIPQAEILMVSKGNIYSKEQHFNSALYNEYFGSGLSSIVFQEIRESKALAYSANTSFTTPLKSSEPHYYRAFVGTQADKMKDAITAMKDIIQNMPQSHQQIAAAVDASKKKIESERIYGKNIYFTQLRNEKLGLDYDYRKDVYTMLSDFKDQSLLDFQKKYIQNRKYKHLILGNKSKLDMQFLQSIGKVEEISLEKLFGY